MKEFTFIDLFCGCGRFSLGIQQRVQSGRLESRPSSETGQTALFLSAIPSLRGMLPAEDFRHGKQALDSECRESQVFHRNSIGASSARLPRPFAGRRLQGEQFSTEVTEKPAFVREAVQNVMGVA